MGEHPEEAMHMQVERKTRTIGAVYIWQEQQQETIFFFPAKSLILQPEFNPLKLLPDH